MRFECTHCTANTAFFNTNIHIDTYREIHASDKEIKYSCFRFQCCRMKC